MTQSILKFENVSKKYGNLFALKGINFSINEKETIGLIGPNGAGKTTALKLIARLINPYEGMILIRNRQEKLQCVKNKVDNLIETGFLIDIPFFYNTNPNSLLRLIANIRNYPKEKLESRMDELLRFFDLLKWKYKKIKTFSKGMKQKLGFICSIIHDPDLVILDEPQTGLDPSSRMKIREYLWKLKREGKSIIISSHLLDELRDICDRVILINEGKLVGYDTIDNLEIKFKTKQLICEIEEPLSEGDYNDLLMRIEKEIRIYLEKNSDNSITSNAVSYNSEKHYILIKYDGVYTSRGKILEILSHKFALDFKITSFYEPRVSQLEKIYSKMTSSGKKGE